MGLGPAGAISRTVATWQVGELWATVQVGVRAAGVPGLEAGAGSPGHCMHCWTSSQAYWGAWCRMPGGCHAVGRAKARAKTGGWVAGSYQATGRAGARGLVAGDMKVTARVRMVFSTWWSSSLASTAWATTVAYFSCTFSNLLRRAVCLSLGTRSLSWMVQSS